MPRRKLRWTCNTYDRTKRSLLTQSGFLGLKVINLLNRTCANGAQPIGAPGCPEFALNVASTYVTVRDGYSKIFVHSGTYRQDPDGVDGLPVDIGVTHLEVCDEEKLW